MIQINNKRIDATPRSKYKKYNGNTNIAGSGGSSSIDTSNFLLLKGRTSQTVEGNILSTSDIVAYVDNPEAGDLKLPIASIESLGCVKIGEGIDIQNDGTISVTGVTGGSGTVSKWGDLTGTLSAQTDLWTELEKKANTSSLNITNWNTAYNNSHTHSNKTVIDGITSTNVNNWNTAFNNNHTHSNKANLDSINQKLGTTNDVLFNSIKSTGDVIAFATGTSTMKFPIASSEALGCIKVGSNLSITEDGTLNASAGGITEVDWSIIKNKPTFSTVSTSGSYNDLLNKPTIPSVPSSLKNPYSLTLSLNGTSQGAYDGSVTKSININYSNVGAAAVSHSHSNYSVTGHTHDDRYYTESEMNTKLNSKSDTSHTHSQYLTSVSLSDWNAGATASGTKTIGNAGNSAYVDIQEDMRVKKACAFSSTPTVNGTSVSLNGHTHSQYSLTSHTHSNYVQKAGDTMSGSLSINSNDYSNVKVYNTKSDWAQFGTTNTSDVSCTIQANKKVLIMARNSYGSHVEFDKGNVLVYGNVTAYYSSDKRLKKDINQLNNSLDLINQLEPVKFKWNNKAKELDSFKDLDTTQYGLIAQQVEKVIPDLVHDQYKDEDGTTYKSVDYVKIVPFLIDSIKELKKEITELKKEINGNIKQ